MGVVWEGVWGGEVGETDGEKEESIDHVEEVFGGSIIVEGFAFFFLIRDYFMENFDSFVGFTSMVESLNNSNSNIPIAKQLRVRASACKLANRQHQGPRTGQPILSLQMPLRNLNHSFSIMRGSQHRRRGHARRSTRSQVLNHPQQQLGV